MYTLKMTTEAGAVNTSFRQYEFCKLCRISHKQKKKHIYSKRHQEILTKILNKFESKIAAAKKTVFNPEVVNISFEENAMFWCYFCEEEFEKHTRLDQCTIKYGSLLQHICGDDHLSKCIDFLWDNIVKVKVKDKYIISKQHYESFKLAAAKAVVSYEDVQKEKHLKEVSRIQEREKLQRAAVLDGERQSRFWKSSRSVTQGYPNVDFVYHSGGIQTTYDVGVSHSETLGRGSWSNNHPGITTPSLQDEEQTNPDIGPSMADYQKYLKTKKKKNMTLKDDDEDYKTSEEGFGSVDSDWNPSRSLAEDSGKQYGVKSYDEQHVRDNVQSYKIQQGVTGSNNTTAIPSRNSPFTNTKTDSFKCVPYKRKHSTTTSQSEFIAPTLLQTPIVGPSVTESTNITKTLHSNIGTEPQAKYGRFDGFH